MAVSIGLSYGDDAECRFDGAEELLCCGVLATVMPNLQYIGTQRFQVVFGQDSAFGLPLCVTRQKDGSIAVLEPQYKRIIVFCVRDNISGSCFRPQKLSVNSVPVEGFSAKLVFNRNSSISGELLQAPKGSRGDFSSNPQSAYTKILEDCRESA